MNSSKSVSIVVSARRKPRQRRKSARGKVSVQKLTKELDTLVSRYVRQFYAKNGIVACYTCEHKAEVKKMQCGHYISRVYKQTRWDLRNLRPQCLMCNIYRKGNAVVYRQNLIKEMGVQAVEELEASVKGIIRGGLSIEYLQAQIALYTSKLNEP